MFLTVEGLGTSAIMRETAKSKTRVWRWQERFAAEGFEGLLVFDKLWLKRAFGRSRPNKHRIADGN
jgi:hypothetical protein